MIKFKNQVGYTVYKITVVECYSFGGLAVCDDCNTFCPSGGYLVPVLNRFMCSDCFNDWNSSCKFYPEDLSFENSIMMYYENMFPVIDSPVPV